MRISSQTATTMSQQKIKAAESIANMDLQKRKAMMEGGLDMIKHENQMKNQKETLNKKIYADGLKNQLNAKLSKERKNNERTGNNPPKD